MTGGASPNSLGGRIIVAVLTLALALFVAGTLTLVVDKFRARSGDDESDG